VAVPFTADFVTHVRFLVVLPLLLMAEPLVGAILAGVARQFGEAHLVPEGERESFERAGAELRRLRDSGAAEAVLLALAFLGAYANLRVQLSLDLSTWRVPWPGNVPHMTMAGWWYVVVSIPLFQFLLYRWAWRFCVWALFLKRTSKLRLRLNAAHADRMGGLAFVEYGQGAFALIVFAVAILLSAAALGKVVYEDANVSDLIRPLSLFVVVATVVPLLPALVFAPRLGRARWDGMMEIGALGTAYAEAFHQKWLKGEGRPEQDLLGTGDIQSLADLGGAAEIVRGMRTVPVSVRGGVSLLVAAALPLAPLALLVYPAREILSMAIGVLF
jgi:hypothetical protein